MFRKVLIAVFAMLGTAMLAYVLYPDAQDEAAGLASAVVADAAPLEAVSISGSGSIEYGLSTANTTIGFSCAKTVAGKTVLVHGGWNDRLGGEIDGVLGLESVTGSPRWLRARIRIDSLWSEHDQLTEALLTMGFFRPLDHPWATFEGHVLPDDSGTSVPGEIMIAGDFELNGVIKHLEFPATVTRADDALSISSAFSLDRHVFGVRFGDSAAFGLLTDEDIADEVAVRLHVEVTSAPDEAIVETDAVEAAVTVEAADVVEAADAAHAAVAVHETDRSPNLPPAEPTVAEVELPPGYTETIPSTQVQFDMVLVPGNAASGLDVFYIGRHEVTWDEFMPWSQGADLEDDASVGEARALKLRPSAPYGAIDRNFGMYRRPALGMSRLAAELYCAWLNEQTGRTYRLPTEAEWEWAYASGGGDPGAPPSSEDADRIATHIDNSWSDDIGDWATTTIGQREPNTLGVYDLAGNVAEWVTGTGDEHLVRGGHFESPPGELGIGRDVEDIGQWNRDYPNEPVSQWWYVNARWVGFRVVCETAPGSSTGP